MAAAGVPDVKEKLLTGYQAGGMTYKVHLDGYNLMPYLKGDTARRPASRISLLDRRWRTGRPAL